MIEGAVETPLYAHTAFTVDFHLTGQEGTVHFSVREVYQIHRSCERQKGHDFVANDAPVHISYLIVGNVLNNKAVSENKNVEALMI